MKVFFTLLFLLVCWSGASAQNSRCAIGDTQFACPSKYFKEIKVDDPDLRVFKYQEKDVDLFFFMSAPRGKFDPEQVGAAVLTHGFKETGSPKWTTVPDPLVMNLDTKYKYDLVAILGLTKARLIEVKAYKFAVAGKSVVLGYVSDWSENAPSDRERFNDAAPVGDSAPGCNAVVTALNSVTKEHKEASQHCSLTVFTTPK